MNRKILISGMLFAFAASTVAQQLYLQPRSNIDTELNETFDINVDRNSAQEDTDSISDIELEKQMYKVIYNKDTPDSYALYRSDIQKYLNKSGGILKLELNGDVQSLAGLDIASDVTDLWISNATNVNLDMSALTSLENLKSLTIINSKLSASDISSIIYHLVHKGALEELYINAAFPGKSEDRDSFVQIQGSGNNPMISALNSINSSASDTKKLKVLSLVGNKWQGQIDYLETLKSTGCHIALDSNSHISTEDANVSIIYTH